MILESENNKIASVNIDDIWNLGVVKVETLGDKFEQCRWNFKNGNRFHNSHQKSAKDERRI